MAEDHGSGVVDALHSIAQYVLQLEKENKELREGACRFNCRSKKAMFIIGARCAHEYWPRLGTPTDKDIERFYEIWLEESKDAATTDTGT